MDVENKIEQLKKVSIENRNSDKKEIYIFEEINFDNYEIGAIINEYEDDSFEVYLYVKGEKKVASKLLLKEFRDLIEAKEYYKEILTLAKSGNLDKIKEKSAL